MHMRDRPNTLANITDLRPEVEFLIRSRPVGGSVVDCVCPAGTVESCSSAWLPTPGCI